MNKKRLLIIGIIAVVLILLAIPAGTLISIHNSSYNCLFPYEKIAADTLLTDIARKNTYYNANDKTVEVTLSQDAINSLIKDNLGAIAAGLPQNILVKEVMFEARDQRIYVNAKYGALNIPLSFKVNIQPDKDGVVITATDILLGNKKAPGFILNRIPADSLKYTLKFADYNLPPAFALKEVKYGTGQVKAVIALDEAKLTELALGYWNDTIKNIKGGSTGNAYLSSFLDKAVATDLLSEKAAKDYIKQALNNEELVNCAIIFAVSGNLDKYPASLQEYGKKIADWAAPLKTVKYYGSVEETMDTILYDDKLKDFLTWFIPGEKIKEYSAAVEGYYALYKDTVAVLDEISRSFSSGRIENALDTMLYDPVIKEAVAVFAPGENIDKYTGTLKSYYAQYKSAKKDLDNTTKGIDMKAVNEYANAALDFASVAKQERQNTIDSLNAFDTKQVDELVKYLESDKTIKEKYLDQIDPYYYEQIKYGLSETDYARDVAVSVVEYNNNSRIESYASTVKKLKDFLTLLNKQDYIKAAETFPAKDLVALKP